MFVDILLLVRV